MQKLYNYKQKLDGLKVRLVVIYNYGKKLLHICHKCPKTDFRCKRQRKIVWDKMELELLFKESKSKYPLDVTYTKNEQVIENPFDY